MAHGWINWMKRIFTRKHSVTDEVLESKKMFPFEETPSSMTRVQLIGGYFK